MINIEYINLRVFYILTNLKTEKFLGTKWAPKIKALQLTIFRSHKGQLGPYTFKGM